MKKTVHYQPTAQDFIEVGHSAAVRPVDHPGEYVSNTTWVRTSEVIRKDEGGVFETMNTIYKPMEVA